MPKKPRSQYRRAYFVYDEDEFKGEHPSSEIRSVDLEFKDNVNPQNFSTILIEWISNAHLYSMFTINNAARPVNHKYIKAGCYKFIRIEPISKKEFIKSTVEEEERVLRMFDNEPESLEM